MSKFVLKAYAFVTQWLPTQSKTLCSHYVIGIDLFMLVSAAVLTVLPGCGETCSKH